MSTDLIFLDLARDAALSLLDERRMDRAMRVAQEALGFWIRGVIKIGVEYMGAEYAVRKGHVEVEEKERSLAFASDVERYQHPWSGWYFEKVEAEHPGAYTARVNLRTWEPMEASYSKVKSSRRWMCPMTITSKGASACAASV